MALLLNSNSLLRSSLTPNERGGFKKLSLSHSFNHPLHIKLQRKGLKCSTIKVTSSVQQQSDALATQTQVSNSTSLELNPDRPDDKLPYKGAWFWVGAEMIHLMELPNPDPVTGRPDHGGRDRHTCVAIKNLDPLRVAFEKAGIPFTQSKSGRPAIFARDPDGNALEFTQT